MADDAAPATRRVSPADGLANLTTGQGIGGRDARMDAFWTMPCLRPEQIQAAYRSSWMVRKLHDVIPAEMVRAWRAWDLQGDEADALKDEEKRLNVREVMREALRLGKLRGGAAVVMGLPGNAATPAPESIGKGDLRYLWVTTRDFLSVPAIDRDLNSPNFGKPTKFILNAAGAINQEIHPSRVLVFPGVPSAGFAPMSVLDEVWGFPLLESLLEPIQNAETALGGVASMIPEAVTDIISIPGLTELVSTTEGEAKLANRLRVSKLMASIWRAKVLDGGDGQEFSGEKWETRQLSFDGLTDVIRAYLQIVAGAGDMPFTKFVGSPPEGMNATGEGDDKNFQTMIKGRQDSDLRPRLEALDRYLIQSAGVNDAKAVFTFNPLHETTPEEQAELDNLTADTFAIIETTGLVQHDALAKTLVSVFNERPTFPSLAANVEASNEPLPAAQAAENATALATAKAAMPNLGANPAKPGQSAARMSRRAARAAAKDAVTVIGDAGPGLRTITDGGETLTLRTVTLAELRDAAARTLFVSRKLLNPQEFLNHWRGQGVEGLMAAGDLHVTVIHSDVAVDWMKLPADWSSDRSGRLLIPPGGPRVVTHLGNYDVLEFASSELQWRHEALVAAGVEDKWPDYKPHVSFRRDDLSQLAQEADVATLKPYIGRLLFGPEIFEEVV